MDIKTKRNNMKVIILSKSSYKEKDCIYSAISPEGFVSFLAKGAQDPKSKYVWLNNPMTVAEIEFLADGRYKHKVVNNAILISSPMKSGSDFNYLLAVNVLTELARNVLSDEEKHLLFNDLEAALNALRIGKDHYMVILVFIAKLIKFSGAELEANKCVSCGATNNIVAFSFDEGGFLCRECINEDTVRDLSKDQMRLIRYIFRARDFTLPECDKYSVDDKKLILKKLREFIDEIVGVKLNSLDALIQ